MVSLPISLIREAYFTKAQSATKYYLSFLEINQVGTKMGHSPLQSHLEYWQRTYCIHKMVVSLQFGNKYVVYILSLVERERYTFLYFIRFY